MALEKTLESPLDCNEIKPVHPKTLNIHWKDSRAKEPVDESERGQ